MALLDNILVGVYIGVLTGVFTALIVFGMTFAFTYIAGVNFPAMYGMMIGLGSAGLVGGIRAFIRNPALLQSSTSVTALLIVLLITLYAHKRGQEFGKALPSKEIVFGAIRKKTLSPDIVKQVGRFGQVTIRTAGEVGDIEGYPPLPDETRTAIREGEWTFPADLPISELEKRLAEKLRTAHDLDEVTVSIDGEGRATVSAAPPSSALSRRVPEDKRAVAVDAPVPTGAGRGDEARIELGEETVAGRIIGTTAAAAEPAAEPPADDGEAPEAGNGAEAPAAADGTGTRVAVAVEPDGVAPVVGGDVSRFLVTSRGRSKEYELVSLLQRDGNRFERISLRPEGGVVGTPISEVGFRETYGVAVFGLRRAGEWLFAPDGATELEADDELFVIGRREGLDALREAVA